MNARPPIIETERLTLRPPVAEDFEAFAAMWADPAVTGHIMPAPLDRENAWRMFLRDSGHWRLNGFGFFTAIDRATNTFAGVVGLARLERTIEPTFGADPEAGWAYPAAFHGKGYATEALNAVLDWGNRNLKPDRYVAMIGEANQASRNVAQKCGFHQYATASYHGSTVNLFERQPSSPQ